MTFRNVVFIENIKKSTETHISANVPHIKQTTFLFLQNIYI